MRVLFDLGHPAHVHLFRNLAKSLRARGDEIVITIRDRGIIRVLLDAYGFEYSIASVPRTGLWGNFVELLVHNWQVAKIAFAFRPDYLIGTSVSAAHVGWLLRRRSIVLNEDDADYVPLFTRITYPFASCVIVPDCLRDKKRSNYRVHKSYHELAYLHPNHFTPDPRALRDMGMTLGDPFFIVRLVSLTAHHDAAATGLSEEQVTRLIEMLAPYGRVFINSEGDLSPRFSAYRFSAPAHAMHDILAHAKLVVSDSQTMTMEAAVLGRPALRCNSFVGHCSVITELEDRYQLAWGYRPTQFDELLTQARELLEDPALEQKLRDRRERLLSEKHDLTEWLIAALDGEFQ